MLTPRRSRLRVVSEAKVSEAKVFASETWADYNPRTTTIFVPTTRRPYNPHLICGATPHPCFGFAPAAPDSLLVSSGRVLLSDQPPCQVISLITP